MKEISFTKVAIKKFAELADNKRGVQFFIGETAQAGGNGGSGIVIIRYPDTYGPAALTTGSPSIVVAGGYRIYTWTASGTITF